MVIFLLYFLRQTRSNPTKMYLLNSTGRATVLSTFKHWTLFNFLSIWKDRDQYPYFTWDHGDEVELGSTIYVVRVFLKPGAWCPTFDLFWKMSKTPAISVVTAVNKHPQAKWHRTTITSLCSQSCCSGTQVAHGGLPSRWGTFAAWLCLLEMSRSAQPEVCGVFVSPHCFCCAWVCKGGTVTQVWRLGRCGWSVWRFGGVSSFQVARTSCISSQHGDFRVNGTLIRSWLPSGPGQDFSVLAPFTFQNRQFSREWLSENHSPALLTSDLPVRWAVLECEWLIVENVATQSQAHCWASLRKLNAWYAGHHNVY